MSDPPRDGVLSPRSFAIAHQRRQSFAGCSKILDYEIQCKLGEGTFGEVHRARAKKTGALVALKKIIMHNEKDGFPITALREIRLLKLLSHKNVLRLEDMAVEHSPRKNDKRKRTIMYMVTPYMDHDLSGLLDNPSVRFTEPQIKCYMLQLLEGLRYLHENQILHRDMKAANLLINNQGILQIADFGLARHYDGEAPKPGLGGGEGNRDYTSLVVTRWYRPPELLMELRKYTPAIDLWGVGCVFGEMLVGKPILTGESDSHQLEIIFDLCGTPTDQTMPGWRSLPGAAVIQPRLRLSTISQRFRDYGAGAISLLKELLKLDWRKRINAIDALQHPYFRNAPLPAAPGDLPTFEASHEFDRRKFHDRRAALPPAPKGGTVGRGGVAGVGPAGMMEGAGFNGDTYASGGRNGNGRNGHNNNNNNNDSRYGRGRVPPPPPVGEQHVPAWHRERGLPPRPPPTADFANGGWDASNGGGPGAMASGGGDRDRTSRSRGGRSNRDDVDTYIPRYDGDSRRHRDEPRDNRRRADDWDRRRGGGGPGGGNGPAGGGGGDVDERSRTSRTRSRSRSPMRDRERERERERERDRDRRR